MATGSRWERNRYLQNTPAVVPSACRQPNDVCIRSQDNLRPLDTFFDRPDILYVPALILERVLDGIITGVAGEGEVYSLGSLRPRVDRGVTKRKYKLPETKQNNVCGRIR